MVDMKMGWFLSIPFIMLMHVDARFDPNSNIEDPACMSCLEASRDAEKVLNNLKIFAEVSALSSQVCQALPADLQLKCLKTSSAYIHRTRFLLQEYFHEESLCNSTGLCFADTKVPVYYGIIKERTNYVRPVEEKPCTACRRAVRDLLWKLREPRMKTKVTRALLDYCEEAEENEEQCKQAVHRYASMVLYKLDHVKPSDLCLMIGFCEEEITL